MTDAAPAPDRDPPPGPQEFGHYRLVRELGRGAQGVVHLAEDTSLGRQVALKMLSGPGLRSPEARSRFQREAELTSRLEHPGICGVHEVGEVEGVPYIAMQYVRGTTLADALTAARAHRGTEPGAQTMTVTVTGNGKGEVSDVMRLIERAARALHAAHEVGLVHRDIKPGNLMITPDGDPVLLDFGLARDTDGAGQTLTQSGQIMGTPAYLAPEQIVAERGGVDRRTDVYGLGVTLFECLTLKLPYEDVSWDGLFHKILAGHQPNPRKLNPRIPPDLRTVIEVAMERDPARRYPTALAFAEDLRRVRGFEPIRVRAASPLTRTLKWSRRHPARATAVVGVAVAALLAGGVVLVQELSRQQAVAGNLAQAQRLLAAGDAAGALVAVARALEREPDSSRALELRGEAERAEERARREARRREDLAAAARARAEAEGLQEEHRRAVAAVAQLREELARLRPAVQDRHAVDADRGAYARKERALAGLEAQAEQCRFAARQSLEQAARLEAAWDGVSPETDAALAGFFLAQWREAIAAGDTARAALFQTAVQRHDRTGAHAEELAGRGWLEVTVAPADAELHLFRYVDLGEVRDGDPIPRLVAVPTDGEHDLWPAELPSGFDPGARCLRVAAVAADSPGHHAGLVQGDLVLALQGAPAAGLFVLEQDDDGPGGSVARVAAVAGAPIADGFDWSRAVTGDEMQLTLWGQTAARTVARRSLRLLRPAEVAAGELPAPVELVALRDGVPVTLTVPAGTASGLRTEATAAPLVRLPGNRWSPQRRTTVAAGSYLLLVRRDGCEEQRVPLLVPRGSGRELAVTLRADGTSPPGFVHVPAGPFLRGGDPRAYQPRPAEAVELPDFWIARRELTSREWFEFVNDPEVLARIEAAGGSMHVPRDVDGKILAQRLPDGAGWGPRYYQATGPDTPVLGVSWQDAQAWLRWRNARAEAAGEAWRYDLPSEDEWEKAARGVDGRPFPWGWRFDPSLAVSAYRKPDWLLDAAGGFELRDESPYGILDLAGSREEWTRDPVAGSGQPIHYKRGGHWGSASEIVFRAASRNHAGDTRAASTHGIRLVARRR